MTPVCPSQTPLHTHAESPPPPPSPKGLSHFLLPLSFIPYLPQTPSFPCTIPCPPNWPLCSALRPPSHPLAITHRHTTPLVPHLPHPLPSRKHPLSPRPQTVPSLPPAKPPLPNTQAHRYSSSCSPVSWLVAGVDPGAPAACAGSPSADHCCCCHDQSP